MNFDWILSPVTPLAMVVVGLFGSLAMWIAAKAEALATSRALEALRVSTDAAMKDLARQIEKLREELPAAPAQSAYMAVQGLNLTTRTKALRMSRRGEATSSIAAALGVPQQEVDLVLKLDRILEAPARS